MQSILQSLRVHLFQVTQDSLSIFSESDVSGMTSMTLQGFLNHLLTKVYHMSIILIIINIIFYWGTFSLWSIAEPFSLCSPNLTFPYFKAWIVSTNSQRWETMKLSLGTDWFWFIACIKLIHPMVDGSAYVSSQGGLKCFQQLSISSPPRAGWSMSVLSTGNWLWSFVSHYFIMVIILCPLCLVTGLSLALEKKERL